MRLAIELGGVLLGHLIGDRHTFDFTADPHAVNRYGQGSTLLSVAIPLLFTQRPDRAPRRRNWFSELLPEGDQYEYMLAQAGIRHGDTPAFLATYGRDVAGALQIWDVDDPTEPPVPALHPLTPVMVRRLLDDPVSAPLGNATRAGRSSLGGVQPKIVLARTEAGWAQATGGAPTTHILKPRLSGALTSLIDDEEYGSRLASRLGLTPLRPHMETFDGRDALVIPRYDRTLAGTRIHQEDMNQALGACGNQKYQEVGGVVRMARVADVVQRYAGEADVLSLARMLVLAVAIGNLDMHAKNISLMHLPDGTVRLAPAYDVVPQAHHAAGGRMSMAVSKVYEHAQLTASDLTHEIGTWGVPRAKGLVATTLEQLEAAVLEEEPLPGAWPHLREDVLGFTQRLLAGRAAGAPAGTGGRDG